MRKGLKAIADQRLRFRATVERFGTKPNSYTNMDEDTILFKNVTRVDTNEIATDHLWFTVGKTIENLNLKAGDTVEFDAKVEPYEKGYVNHRQGIDNRTLDYKLTRPTKFKKINSTIAEQEFKTI